LLKKFKPFDIPREFNNPTTRQVFFSSALPAWRLLEAKVGR